MAYSGGNPKQSMKHIFLIAGEPSGDMHGAHLIRALRAADPELRCSGLGGVQMQQAGMELHYDLAADPVMGFVEVLRKALPLRRLFLDTLERVRRERPRCVVLIDYPGFNLRFAKAVHALGIPVIYYIGPQVWAWKRKRLDTLARVVSRMLVIFPFEEDLYRDKGVDCVYVGHPLLDEIARTDHSDTKNNGAPIIGLLPGSRAQEIRRIAPVMAQTGISLLKKYPELQFVTPCLDEARAAELRLLMAGLPVEIVIKGMHQVLAQSRCCLVASGTATLETALFGVPMCIVYKVNPLSYWLARLFVRIPFIGLVNIVLEREAVPELIQHEAVPEKILPIMEELVEDSEKRRRMEEDLEEVKRRLQPPGASTRAAAEILALINRN